MAESSPQTNEFSRERRGLKYLAFVPVAVVQAVVCFASIYEFAKENAGPLCAGVQAVENAVRAVLGPVYDRFHHVPLELLLFVDRKVDEALRELERHVPVAMKTASARAYAVAHGAPEVARSLAVEVKRSGVPGAARAAYERYEPAARELYGQYEPLAKQYAVATWRSLHRLPLFPQVAQILVPTTAYWAEKYNSAVGFAAARGFPAAAYLPAIPTERIAKVFGSGEGRGAAPVRASGAPAKANEVAAAAEAE